MLIASHSDQCCKAFFAQQNILQLLTVVARDMQEQFERDYSAVQRRAMTTNYRSTASIIARSNALIACNYTPARPGRLPKALIAAPGTLCNDPVQFVRYKSKESQGQHLLESVNWYRKNGSRTHWDSMFCLSVICSLMNLHP